MGQSSVYSFFQTKLIFISALFFLTTLFFIKPSVNQETLLLPPSANIKYFSVGFKITLASALWLRILQNIDYCEQKINKTQCIGKSWLFKNLDLATDLDPIFESDMYRMGALALSILISDNEGALIIFDKGIKQYPNNWPLLYAAGYQAYFEEKNKKKASELYFRAAQNGAPDWVHVLAGRLAAEGGEFDYAEKILQTMIDTNQEEKYIIRLKEKLANLKKEKNLLNSKANEAKKDL